MAEKLYRDKDWLYKQYWVRKKSTTEMATLANCGSSTIATWMEKLGIPRRTPIEALRLKAKNPEYLEKMTRAARRRSQDPEWQINVAEGARRRSQDPNWRKRHAAAIRRKARDPEWRRRQRAGIRHKFQDPKFRRKIAERNRRIAQSPKWRKAHAKAMREVNRRRGMKRRNQGEMTDIEAICYAAFESLDLDFVFEKFIKRYRVDFFFPSHGIIVEAMGIYWHQKPKRQRKDAERKEFLEACGYVVLEWAGSDIKADVWQLIEEELLPLLDQPSRMEKPPKGVSKPYKGPRGWKSATQLYLLDED